jgi:hypothetical protein
MSTLLFETYVLLGESLFYFAHLPPGSSNPAMAKEYIYENGFAQAFGGAGGTRECRGGCPPGPPLCW